MSTSYDPGGGVPTSISPEDDQISSPPGPVQPMASVCIPSSPSAALRRITSVARGCTAGRAPICSASNTPRILSLPSCEMFAASAKRAKETCMPKTTDGGWQTADGGAGPRRTAVCRPPSVVTFVDPRRAEERPGHRGTAGIHVHHLGHELRRDEIRHRCPRSEEHTSEL